MGQGFSVQIGSDKPSQIFTREDRPCSDVDQSAKSVSASSVPDSDSSVDTAKPQEEEEEDAVDAGSVPPDISYAHLISSSSHQQNDKLTPPDSGSKKFVSKHRHNPPLTLNEFTGHYLAFCLEIAGVWSDKRRHPKQQKRQQPIVDILPATSEHGVVASFCFGPLEGTMLISLSEEALDMFMDEMAPAASLQQAESNSESSSSSRYPKDKKEEEAPLEGEPQHDSSKKRKRADSQSTATASSSRSKCRKHKSKSKRKKNATESTSAGPATRQEPTSRARNLQARGRGARGAKRRVTALQPQARSSARGVGVGVGPDVWGKEAAAFAVQNS